MSETSTAVATIPAVLPKATTVEVRLPSRLGFEKVAMATAASVAKLMGFLRTALKI